MRVHEKGTRATAVLAIGAAGAAIGLAATAGSAAAAPQPATLTVNQACYVTVSKTNRPTMVISGSGFNPGDTVLVTDKTGDLDVQTQASPTGTITVSAKAPVPFLQVPGAKSDTITATDYTTTGVEIQGTATTQLSVLFASFGKTHRAPGLGAYREKTTWRFSGFPTGRKIYGHYFLGRKLVARQSFGRAQGPCGVLVSHRRILPVAPHSRNYNMYVESRKKYSKKAVPRFPVKLRLVSV